ncbi:alpha/beta hydrolase [Agromyces sp. Marseille-Q5079]|uniref:alpha/beta hydrolase n=1 Tax=Agromyces sp. Marseille-Q5079 TaxID=3439059 RepID=UPI003D9C9232
MSHLTAYSAADWLVRVYPASTADAATRRPTPALVWAHGGGFVAGDLDMPEADWVARSLADRGIAVISVDYRLASAGHVYPAASDDVLAAWRWTIDHASELGIDPARTALGGASAGGNLVAGAVLRMLAVRSTPDPVGGAESGDAVGAAPDELAPPTGPSAPLPAGLFLAYPTLLAVQPAPDAALRALLDANPGADRFGPAQVLAMYEGYLGAPVDAPPLAAVPGLATTHDLAGHPPVLMINGEADELRVSGEAYAATLAAAGVDLELHLEPGTEHGHLNRPDEAAASASIDRLARWIRGLESGADRPARPATELLQTITD